MVHKTQDEIDFLLALFLKFVRNGKQPPMYLLEFIADGVEAFKKDAKAWQVKTGRKAKGATHSNQIMFLQAYCLRNCGFNNNQIGGLLGDENGNMAEKTIQRAVRDGKKCRQEAGAGNFMYKWAVEELLKFEALTSEQTKRIKAELVKIEAEANVDDFEPDYFDPDDFKPNY